MGAGVARVEWEGRQGAVRTRAGVGLRVVVVQRGARVGVLVWLRVRMGLWGQHRVRV